MRRSFPIIASAARLRDARPGRDRQRQNAGEDRHRQLAERDRPDDQGLPTSSNVDPSQARFATCAQAKQVMVKTTELRVEKRRSTKAFYCVPTVNGTTPTSSPTSDLQRRRHRDVVELVFEVKYGRD